MRETQERKLVLMDVSLSDCRVHTFADNAAVMLSGTTITLQHLKFSSFDIDGNSFSSIELRDNGVNEGSLVYMLGYPMGLVNVNSELPICRMGCIARICEEQIAESHDALLDMQNFPGNSESSIVSKSEFIGIQGIKIKDRCVLIGIIHANLPFYSIG